MDVYSSEKRWVTDFAVNTLVWFTSSQQSKFLTRILSSRRREEIGYKIVILYHPEQWSWNLESSGRANAPTSVGVGFRYIGMYWFRLWLLLTGKKLKSMICMCKNRFSEAVVQFHNRSGFLFPCTWHKALIQRKVSLVQVHLIFFSFFWWVNFIPTVFTLDEVSSARRALSFSGIPGHLPSQDLLKTKVGINLLYPNKFSRNVIMLLLKEEADCHTCD